MPLQSGTGEKKHGANVAEMLASYKKKGKIGNTRPKNKRHAERIANAIAFQKRREAGEKIAKA